MPSVVKMETDTNVKVETDTNVKGPEVNPIESNAPLDCKPDVNDQVDGANPIESNMPLDCKPDEKNPLDGSNQAVLSKRAMKKLLKRQTWLDSKAERKAILKQKRKAKVEQHRAEGKFDVSYSQTRKRLKRGTKMVESPCKVNVVIDTSFDHLMSEKDLGKCFKQLLRCYSMNRRLAAPMQLHVCGLTGAGEALMQARHSGFENWDCNFGKESYVDIFTSGPYYKSKSDIIYLSSDSENVLGETLDPSKVYVIGGFVDHNKHKGLCHKLAVEKSVGHARLPIDEYIELKTRKVLTIDQVYQILAKVGSEGKSWKEAFLSIIPARKGAKGLDSDDSEDEDSDHNENENDLDSNNDASDKIDKSLKCDQTQLS